MHIYQLCGEIEVTLQITGVNDIDDYIGGMLNELFTYVELFGRIGRERISAREVDE
jgi:hypothetical protein